MASKSLLPNRSVTAQQNALYLLGARPRFVDPTIWVRLHYYSRFRKIVNYLEANSACVVNLAALAKVGCMSTTAFSKLFKVKIGITVKYFVSAYKISKAHEIMINSDLSITEITNALGFVSLSTFERTFQRITGQTPSQYRIGILKTREILPCDHKGCS